MNVCDSIDADGGSNEDFDTKLRCGETPMKLRVADLDMGLLDWDLDQFDEHDELVAALENDIEPEQDLDKAKLLNSQWVLDCFHLIGNKPILLTYSGDVSCYL